MMPMSSTVRMPPPTVNGMKQRLATRSITSTIVSRPCALAVMSKKNHLVSTLLIISDGQLDRVADVAQATLLRTAKLHPACHGAIVHIKAGNHSFG
jgi:hypothetical protein